MTNAICSRLSPLMASLRIIALTAAVTYAANANVVDVKGQSYSVSSVRLAKGGKIKIVCGETLLTVPFKDISSMKIDPAQISPIGGQPHFGVEVKLRDGSVLGKIEERGRCLVCADNGLRGKTSKRAAYSAPFGNLSGFQMLGKGETKARESDEEDDGEEE